MSAQSIQQFLSAVDADRALRVLRKLAHHHIRSWALTGGFAIEVHLARLGRQPNIRTLNDLDFIVASFDCIPETLADDFLFRHIHPLDPPGKTLLQVVDSDSALRIDVFRAYGATMSRTCSMDLPGATIQLVSLEDLCARAARLALDLADGVPVPSKHARDFLRLLEVVRPADGEKAWQDHRRPNHAMTFEETVSVLRGLILARQNLLITPDYARDIEEVCTRCVPTAAFRLPTGTCSCRCLGIDKPMPNPPQFRGMGTRILREGEDVEH